MDFAGKTLIVTGAASGMGLLCAQEFAKYGANVVMADCNEEAVKEKAMEIGEQAAAIGCDVRNYEEVCKICEFAMEKFGSINFLVPMAGGAECRVHNAKGEFPDIPIEVYDWGLDVNLKGPFYLDHAALKYMRDFGGAIIHIGSVTGAEGSKKNMSYATSKAALMHGLTKSVAQYGAKYGITCNCVAPGPVMTRPGMESMSTLLGRPGEPQEIIDLILYLCSDKGSYITGETIMIDGGRSVMSRPITKKE